MTRFKYHDWDAPQYDKEMAIIALCGLMADVQACVSPTDEGNEHRLYNCFCSNSFAKHLKNTDLVVSKDIVEFIENAVHAAITEHQKGWDK